MASADVMAITKWSIAGEKKFPLKEREPRLTCDATGEVSGTLKAIQLRLYTFRIWSTYPAAAAEINPRQCEACAPVILRRRRPRASGPSAVAGRH
jgi:hypothetical protein